jgi:hypothetical protein
MLQLVPSMPAEPSQLILAFGSKIKPTSILPHPESQASSEWLPLKI